MTDPKDTLKSATEDLALIRNTMDRSRYHFDFLSTVFLIYGAVMLAGYIGVDILFRHWASMGGRGSFLPGFLPYVLLIPLFCFYFVMRKTFIKSETVYSLHLYDVWGVVLFLLPMLYLPFRLMSYTAFVDRTPSAQALDAAGILSSLASLLTIFASVIVLLITAILLRDRPMLFLSFFVVVLIFVFLLGVLFSKGSAFERITSFEGLSYYLARRVHYLKIGLYLLYLIIGFYFKIRKYN